MTGASGGESFTCHDEYVNRDIVQHGTVCADSTTATGEASFSMAFGAPPCAVLGVDGSGKSTAVRAEA